MVLHVLVCSPLDSCHWSLNEGREGSEIARACSIIHKYYCSVTCYCTDGEVFGGCMSRFGFTGTYSNSTCVVSTVYSPLGTVALLSQQYCCLLGETYGTDGSVVCLSQGQMAV